MGEHSATSASRPYLAPALNEQEVVQGHGCAHEQARIVEGRVRGRDNGLPVRKRDEGKDTGEGPLRVRVRVRDKG